MSPPPVTRPGPATWLLDRGIEIRQALAARPARTVVSVLAAALSAAAFLGLTGASRISEDRVSQRLDRLRPTQFTLTTNDDSPLVTRRLGRQLGEIVELAGARGALLVAEVQVPDGPPSAHPVASRAAGGDPVPVFAVSGAPSAGLGAGMAAGREIDAGHVRRGDRIAEVGAQAAADLELPDLRGRPRIFVGGLPFEAVGVTAPIRSAPDLATGIFVPYSAATRAFGARALQSQRIIVRGTVRALPRLEQLAPYVLRPERPASIEVTALGDPVSLRADVASQLARLVGVVTAGAVLFGAIVVAITFFSSVTERRQEFGLRRAVGARTIDIAGFVIGETAVVGLAGGVVGLALGGIGLAVASAGSSVGFPMSGVELALAPALGTAVGLVAGLLPAAAAVRIDPHTALTT